jgi:GT2 family glycosyltransferase
MTDYLDSPRVHIVILNWNGWQDTIECLESLLRIDYPNYQIVVCDNDSQNNSVENIVLWAEGKLNAEVDSSHSLSRLTQPFVEKPVEFVELNASDVAKATQINSTISLVIIRTGGNLGFAGGNNVGMRYALQQDQSDFVWMLNNDTVVEHDCLQKMVEHSSALTAQGVKNSCGSVQCFYDDPNVIQALGGFGFNKWTGICTMTLGRFLKRDEPIDHDAYRAQMDTIHGCSWLLPRSYLEEIGLMEEGYFLYYEEIDWTLRSRDTFAMTYAEDAFVYHKEGSSIGSKTMNRGASLLSEFYMNSNKFKVAKKFNPITVPTVWAALILQALNRIRQGQIKNALMLFKVAFGKKTYP